MKQTNGTPPAVTRAEEADPTLALFAQWDLEDATDDPEKIARRQQAGDELLASLRDSPLTLRRVTIDVHLHDGAVARGAAQRPQD